MGEKLKTPAQSTFFQVEEEKGFECSHYHLYVL